LACAEQLGFQLVWLVSTTQLRLSAGRANRTFPPSGFSAAVHHAAVVRLPLNVAVALAPALERLREYGPQHYYYPPDTMHTTVLTLDGFLPDVANTAGRIDELRAVIASHPYFDLTVCGLNVSPTTVFAQIVSHDRTLRSLKWHLRETAKRSVPQVGDVGIFGAAARTLLAHANVVRFSGLVTAEFLDELSHFRKMHFGRWTVREVELVRTDKLLSREGRQVIERIPLAPPQPP
jgi:2'-5' RNA ligase